MGHGFSSSSDNLASLGTRSGKRSSTARKSSNTSHTSASSSSNIHHHGFGAVGFPPRVQKQSSGINHHIQASYQPNTQNVLTATPPPTPPPMLVQTQRDSSNLTIRSMDSTPGYSNGNNIEPTELTESTTPLTIESQFSMESEEPTTPDENIVNEKPNAETNISTQTLNSSRIAGDVGKQPPTGASGRNYVDLGKPPVPPAPARSTSSKSLGSHSPSRQTDWPAENHGSATSGGSLAATILSSSLPSSSLASSGNLSASPAMYPRGKMESMQKPFGREEVLVAASNGLVVGATPSISSSQKPHGQSGNPSFSINEIPDWIRKYETVMGHVNQYVMFDRIGSGAQGSVYKCLNLKDKKIYAIKALENASLRKRRKPGSSINSLKNEIGIMKMLDHPNLVKLYEVIDDLENDRLYLVIDYVQGGGVMGDLDLMNGGPELAIPEERARRLFGDFVLGMEYLHNHGVLHRDIKPSNMLIDNNTENGEPRVKVCDFGVSSLCNREKSAKVLGEDDLIYVGGFGTVAMMCPEALGCGPDNIYHGRPADVWAAGVTLYCMVTGTLPWHSKDAESLTKEICEDTPISFPARPKLSKDVRRLILKMLERDPNQRITFSLIRQEPWFHGTNEGYSSHPGLGNNNKHIDRSDASMDDEDDRVHPTSSSHSNGSSGGLLDSFRRSSWGSKGRSGRLGSQRSPRDTWLANIQAVLNTGSSRKHFGHSSSGRHNDSDHIDHSTSAPDLQRSGLSVTPSPPPSSGSIPDGINSPCKSVSSKQRDVK
mmetsp:Transcript_18846/g.36986  ORF Transcript_18846/g.36986 Transcript_18846/m.36986 type:complete len:771 (-) Transcript_18846:27-2339(-)